MSDTIDNKLEIQIENFIKEHSETSLIVIDTLQKIRNNTFASVNPYAAEYDNINALKQIADKYKIAIVLVHHLRKTGDRNPVNMISETSGIAGGADTNFILQKEKRIENRAMLICTERDIEQRELFLKFNKNTFLWELRKPIELEQKKVDEVIILLSDFIKWVKSFTGTVKELGEELKTFNETECSPAILKKKIIKYIDYLSQNYITYSENRTFERREFTLVYDGKNENDGMTVEPPPLNLPFLPSALSVKIN